MRPKRDGPPRWSILVAIALGGLVAVGVLWGLWLGERAPGPESTGLITVHEQGWLTPAEVSIAPPGQAFQEDHTWQTRFDLEDPASQRVIPYLPWRQRVQPSGNPGGTVSVEMTVNGEQVVASKVENGAGTGLGDTATPEEGAIHEGLLNAGENTLVIEARVVRPALDGTVATAFGPPSYEIVSEATGGGAGPVPGLHPGLVATPTALLAGIGVSRVTRDAAERFQAARGARP